jgi:Trk K+ transport system NAD-binding subunit
MPVAGHVVVCGVDHLGVRTVDELRLRGETVVVVASSLERATDMGVRDARVIAGDHRLARVLGEAGVADASAIVLTDDNDLGNLTAALAAQELNPEIRVVIRMFDGELGAHLQELFPSAVALSSSALAAPGFVTAAIEGETGDRFELGGKVLTATTASAVTAPAPDPTPSIAIARLRPDRTVEVLPDDATDPQGLIVLRIEDPATAAARGTAGTEPYGTETAGSMPRRRSVATRLADLPAAVRARLASPERRLVRFVLILLGLAAISALFFGVTAGLGPLDAVSYAVTLLTGASLLTAIDVNTAPESLRVYAIFLSLVGAALVAIVYAFITDAIVRSRLLQTLGRRAIPSNIHDHVIVCGLGAIGYRVATDIEARGVPVVVIERNEDARFVAPARAAGIPVVIGDARHRELLAELGVKRARALVATTSDDLVNLAAALNARSIRPDLRVVLRLFDPDFAIRVQRGFGIRFTRSVSHLAAPAFAAAAMGSEVVASIPVGDRRVVLVARIAITEGSALVGRSAASIAIAGERRCLAIEPSAGGEMVWRPEGDVQLAAGDALYVIATRAGLAGVSDLARARAETATAVASRIVRRGVSAGVDRILRLASSGRIGQLFGPRR